MLYLETNSNSSSQKKESTDTEEPNKEDSFELYRRRTQKKSEADNFIYT